MSGILSGEGIRQALQEGRIQITPYHPEHINPASIDMTLGRTGISYQAPHRLKHVFENERGRIEHYAWNFVWDVRTPPDDGTQIEIPETGLLLEPDQLYLLHTAEEIYSEHYVAVLDGKSSLGRRFISVHETAGYVDPGFRGQITMEVTARYPIMVYPGMRFAQVRFHSIEGPITLYNGHYTGERAKGAVASLTHEQTRQR